MAADLGATTQGVDPTTYECDQNYDARIQRDADALVDGVVPIRDYDAVTVGDDVDWSIDPFDDRGWRFQFHSTTYLYTLFAVAQRAPDSEPYLQRARAILQDWVRDNPRQDAPSDFSWDQHATALRTDVLACAATLFPDEQWVADALQLHGKVLADDDFYAGTWNHGLDQNLALLAAGCLLGQEEWMDVAEARATQAVRQAIDEEGVSNEQAIGYHYYNYQRYGTFVAYLERCGREVPAEFERRDEMPPFLAHATMPDGTYAQIGDTLRRPAEPISGTVAEFAATAGAAGPRPDRRIAVYEAGYVFGRTGWGTERPFEDEMFYALRFGPARIIHGHNDHTSLLYYDRRRPILVDAGFSGYDKSSYRDFLRTPEAHNGVVVNDGSNFFWDAETTLVDRQIEDRFQFFDLIDEPYHRVTRRRGVLISEDPRFVLVRDNLVASRSRPFEQLWHLPPDFDVALGDHGATATADDTAVHIVQLIAPDSMDVVTGSTDPWQGWVSRERGDRTPAPTMVARQTADRATFLTLIAVTDAGVEVDASMAPAEENTAMVDIQIGDDHVTAVVDDQGKLQLATDRVALRP